MGNYTLKICKNMQIDNMIMAFNSIDKVYNYYIKNVIIIDFELCDYISPSSLTVLLSYITYKKRMSRHLHIDIIQSNTIDAYISRVDFYNILGITKEETFCRHDESGRFTTIKNICGKMNYELLNEIMEIITRNMRIQKELYYAMDWAFNELLDNIIEHAESITGGFLIAQTFPNLEKIELCIADNGVGISASLRNNKKYAMLSNEECMLKAIEKGGTDGKGQGNGLYITKRFIYQNDAIMNIYSDNVILTINGSNANIYKSEHYWKGTIIKLSINMNNNIDIYDMFEANDNSKLPVNYIDSIDESNVLW